MHPRWLWPAFAFLFGILSLARPVDHDESQYVAATVLAARGLLPYRDFAYLQTPLQPLLLAPVAWIAGAWTWPALRLVNAALGAVAVRGVHRAAREAGAGARAALVAAGLFAATDVLLFSIGTARNDALPAALLATALPLIVRAEDGRGARAQAVLIGLLLAAAAATKISYALPAAAYGLWSLVRRRHQPALVALGALSPALLVLWIAILSPEGFRFGVFDFPVRAPIEYWARDPWKITLGAKALDALVFLSFGAALPALVLIARGPRRGVPAALLAAGLVAALLPTPSWRQYFLPALPPLFALLALGLDRPLGRWWRFALLFFALAGLWPSVRASGGERLSLSEAMRRSAAIRVAMDRAGVRGPVLTLSPQFLPAAGRPPTPESATGPFYFRSTALLDGPAERRLRVVSRARPRLGGAAAALTGGEGRWTAGNDGLDVALAAVAQRAGWRETPVPGGRFRLFTPPGASPRPAAGNSP